MTTLSNDQLTVELDDLSLALKVTDKRSGAVWATPGAGFDLQTYDNGNQHYRWYSSRGVDLSKTQYGANPASDCRIELRKESEIRAAARVDFTGLNLGFDVFFTLQGHELTVTIPEAGWNLAGEKGTEVISLDCFPLFGGRPRGADGYLVLPHFGGAIRSFADRADRAERMATAVAGDGGAAHVQEMGGLAPDPGSSQIYSAMCYGYQGAWRDLIGYPLWGTIVGDTGWSAHVPFKHGDCDVAVVTAANRGKEKLCGAWGRFHYREHSHDQRVEEDRKMVFTFFHQKGLNYATFGSHYRGLLIEREGIPTLRQKAAASESTAYFTGASWMRPMLALKRYYYINNPNPDGKGILDVYIDCDKLCEELRRWKKAGIEKLQVQIVGANSEGHDGNYPTYFPLEPKVGGEEGFKRLLATIKELDYRSSVHVNIRTYNRPAPDFLAEHVMRDRDGAMFYESSGPGGDDYAACPTVACPAFVSKTLTRLKELGLTGGLYTDFMIGILFRCYHPKHPLTRRGYLDAIRKYLGTAKEMFGSTRAESVIAPVLDQVDMMARAHATPTAEHLARGSEMCARGLADETVPLQLIVFHGIILHGIDNTALGEKDYWDAILKLVATGSKPCEEPRGPQPQWDDLHVFEYRTLVEKMGWLQFEFMEDYQQTGEVTTTRYSDGTMVYVNHGREAAKAGGRSLPGRSFLVKPGDSAKPEIFIEEDPALCDRPPAICPDGSKWPDGRPREGVVMTAGKATSEFGKMIGKDFA
jgi:hypothetical protein